MTSPGRVFARRSGRWAAAPAIVLLLLVLGACAGVDLGAVRQADRSSGCPTTEDGKIIGRILHIVDGQPLAYGIWNRPALQLVQHGIVRMATPITDPEGRFSWCLPAGEYHVSVIVGGLSPTGQAQRLPHGGVVFVNGIVDPGIFFTVMPGTVTHLGTVELSVASAPQKDVWFGSERVFGRLLGIRRFQEP